MKATFQNTRKNDKSRVGEKEKKELGQLINDKIKKQTTKKENTSVYFIGLSKPI